MEIQPNSHWNTFAHQEEVKTGKETRERLKSMSELAQQNLEQPQQRQKSYYDQRTKLRERGQGAGDAAK
ncbi:hypothetical protein JOB18_021902 [Solea senegalensis]|uniref:Uncharacterized protein n=1 Tax=Solea senegalensis TaxID=28829 RepID=A0AAV6T6I7_SOLSE|nr:hypothetical protein JOB18_021902 [Solea senegalensis]